MKRIFLLIISIILFESTTYAQISTVPFGTGFTQPLDVKNCGDNRLFIVEQTGYIRIIDTAGNRVTLPFLDLHTTVLVGSEQGLLGLAFAPDYLTSGYFYVNYTNRPSGRTTIARFRVSSGDPNRADSLSQEILLTIYQPYSNHNGGHLAFGPDGYLYIGMGDGGSGGDPQNRAQNTDSLLGKILRIAVDPSNPTYSIPPTNPFASNPNLGRGEIWFYGMRNPWRWSFDRCTHDFWIGDVGQGLVEEVDFVPAGTPGGLNMGWRCYEGNQSYDLSGGCGPISAYYAPVRTYTHTGGNCSITGGYIYRGSRFNQMYGKYFYTDYCVSNIHYLLPNGSGGFNDTNLGNLGPASVTSFGEDRWGELYCTAGSTVYKFISGDCTPVATINCGMDTSIDCGTGSVNLSVPEGRTIVSYAWSMNGTSVGSNAHEFIATQAGTYSVIVTNDSACTSTDSIVVNFVPPVNVSFSGLDTLYCVYHAPVNLSPNPLGGVFSGDAISGATFTPSLAGIGNHTITYTYTDSRKCTASFSIDTRIDACSGIPESSWLHSITIYPNPNNGDFVLDVVADKERRLNVQINDLLGKQVMSEVFVIPVGSLKIPISTKQLSSGVYSVKFTEGGTSATRSMVIK